MSRSSLRRAAPATLFLLYLWLTMPSELRGQFEAATVLGTIRDPSGAVVTGAKVTLENLGTGIATTAQTDEMGNYYFFNVRAGTYRVRAEAPGFKLAVADAFTVAVAARQRVDLTLEVGTATESITVTGAALALETETSSRGTIVSTQQVVNLPLNGRAYADLALLAPGVRRSMIASSRDASFNVNGMRSSQNNFLLDGVDNNAYGTSNQGFSNQVVQITPDAMQEFRLETNNFSAEYGRAGGAVINATIRSGTNDFHGSVWEYLRNTRLNATGFFKPVQNRKPVLIQNQFGGALGGPIRKEKAFFFADYEGYRRVSRTVTFATIPTLEMRKGILGVPIMHPYTGERYTDGVVPERVITRFAREVLNELPAPNRPGLANNFQSEPRRTDQTDKGDIRLDYYFSSKLTGFVRYSHRLMNNFEPPAIPGPSGGNSNADVRVMNWQWAWGGTYTLSPTALLEFRMGVSLTEGGKFPMFRGTPTIGERFGIPNIPKHPLYTGGIPAQSITGFTQLGIQSSNPQFQDPFVVNPKFNYAKVIGRHSLKMGYEHQRINTDIEDFHPKYGSDIYGGRFSRVPGTATSDVQYLADFLFGARSRYQLTNFQVMGYRQRMHFWYLQDDIKVSPKLTLNVGARYEFATPQYEAQNRISNFDAAAIKLVEARSGSLYNRALVHPDRTNWAPRVGLAYTLTQRTVIRTAYGLSYMHFHRMGGENILAYNLPWILNPIIDQLPPTVSGSGLPLCTGTRQSPFECFRTTEMGYPDNFLSLANINVIGVRTNYIPPNTPTAYTQSWHFTIQRELARDLVLDLAYVGNRSVHLPILGDYNQARPNQPNENLTIQARRPIPSFGYIQICFNGGFLNYHAFQSKLERRFAGGFYLLNSFTWSKGIDNASGHLEAHNGDNSRVNYRDLKNEKGVSGYHQPFINVTTVLWDLPYGKGRRFGASAHPVVNGVLGGWRLAVINFAYAGMPVNLSYNPASQFQVSSAPTYRPNVTGDPMMPKGQRTAERWLNPDTVQIPTDPSRPFGNAGRNIALGPPLHQMNFGLHKDFPIREASRVEVRMEAFNFLNKTNFGTPNGNRSSAAFGTISSLAQPAREIQLAVRYAF